MATYKFMFKGRQAGAIGIFYQISETYKADTLSEAKSLLYEDYEHIQISRILEGSKGIDKSYFNAAPFVPVRSNKERKRDLKGSYFYSRSDTPITELNRLT